tara:strand:+ start:998 stop:1387 length:390 start_codon:yes stop_codon:yes gene_type:complete
MSFLKSINRQMERNQAASRALLEYYDQSSICDMEDFDKELWSSIASSNNEHYSLEIKINDEVSLDFLIKLFVKIGFSCEDSVRLMMLIHKNGSVLLARAEESLLIRLQAYINAQAREYACRLTNRIIKI